MAHLSTGIGQARGERQTLSCLAWVSQMARNGTYATSPQLASASCTSRLCCSCKITVRELCSFVRSEVPVKDLADCLKPLYLPLPPLPYGPSPLVME